MNKMKVVFAFFILTFLLSMVSAASYVSTGPSSIRDVNTQSYPYARSYSSADINTYWPTLNDRTACEGRQDILLQIAPFGCQPTVVRSDLLGEQNVPVMCQLDALEVNPLIDIKTIDSISFRGNYPKEVAATGFYPARSALTNRDELLGDPLINNIGYVTVVLKKQANESALPDSVTLNLTARIRYDAYNALGIGQASFILPEQTDTNYFNSSLKQSFWQGRYSIKADELTSTYAKISIFYQGKRLTTVTVERGKQSSDIFIPGFSTCNAAMRVAYDGFEDSGKARANIEVSNSKGTDVYDVYAGSRFANNKCSVSSVNVDNNGETGTVRLSCGGKSVVLSLTNPSQTSSSGSSNTKTDTSSEYYKNVQLALTEYKKVIENYPSEVPSTSATQTYGETALRYALDLAFSAGLDQEYQNLLVIYKQNYPNADISYYENRKVSGIDRSNAMSVVEISGNYYSVKLLGLTAAKDKPSASLTVNGNKKEVSLSSSLTGESRTEVYSNKATNTKLLERITLLQLTPEEVKLRSDCPAQYSSARDFTLSKGETANICGQTVRVDNLPDTKVGLVRVIPNIQNTETETNLTVRIGIEKRAIQLSPEKAQKMVNNLNKSIEKWESISKSLSKAVTGLKTACFATAAVLTAKNFISGLDGTSLARKQTMTGDNGWSAKCTSAFKSKTVIQSSHSPYVSVDDCLRQNADSINKDVEIRKTAIENENKKIENIEKSNNLKKETTFGSIIDTDGSAKAYFNLVKSSGSTQTKEVLGKIDEKFVSDGLISYSDLKSLELNSQILENPDSSSVQQAAAKAEIKRIQESIDTTLAEKGKSSSYAKQLNLNEQIDVVSTNPKSSSYSYSGSVAGAKHPNAGSYGIKENTPIKYIVVDNVQYALTLNQANEIDYSINSIYTVDSNNNLAEVKDQKIIDNIKSKISGFKKYTEASYNNLYKSPEIRFHETEPYKGMPAVVPVDTTNGWYAATQQTLPVLGQQATFQSSGKVSSFWLCNVGSDGEEEFEKSDFGGDICQQFNFYTGQATNKFPGLSDEKTQALVNKAIVRINQAAKQYSSGLTSVLFDDGQKMKVGNPAVGITAARCQDYMSPKECLLLFNVCDPVICPSSRCNLGGQYYVSNVPETGIVGSALLCLPNAREGIAVPVCLTGLQTGVDGFVSIMKSHRDCLAEQLTTGKTVGICDEIYSVYMCEFFWKQAAPIANMIVPKIAEAAYGQNTKGGGEYLTVMNAWQETQKSVSYFTQQYAVNSIQAFKVRSVAEAGGEFCKAFASITSPKALKSLVETDSPPQFHAYFSSTKFNDVTVPATNQYKVFYHIFAGKDSGVSYQVYLKNTDGSSYYNIPQTVMVSTGFIGKGEYASQTKDFTAPEGYKELCVRVNGREECGFGQVSTSFAVNYLTDQARSSELTRTDITSQSECISGTVGSTVSIGPNIQSTVESTVNPEVYKSGIIRICGTTNPGGTTSPSRYKQVGYCDNQAVGCWLDTESVARALTEQDAGVRNETLSTLSSIADNALTGTSTSLSSETATGKINEIKERVEKLTNSLDTLDNIKTQGATLINDIFSLEKQIPLNHQLAELGIQKAKTYEAIALAIRKTAASDLPAAPKAYTSQTNKPTATVDDSDLVNGLILGGNYKDLTSTQISALDDYVKNNLNAELNFVRGTYNSVMLGYDKAAYYVSLGNRVLPIYVTEDPSKASGTLTLYFTTSWLASNTPVGAVTKQANGNWKIKFTNSDSNKAILKSIFLLDGKEIKSTTLSASELSTKTNAASTTTSQTTTETKSGYSFDNTGTFSEEFIKNAKKWCLIDEPSVAPATGLAAGSSVTVARSILSGVSSSPTVTLSSVDEALTAGKVIVERSADILVKYNGVWKSVPKGSVIAPYLAKLGPVITGASGAVAGGLNGWGAVCSGVNVYLAVDEFGNMVTALNQLSESGKALEEFTSRLANQPSAILSETDLLREHLSYLASMTNDKALTNYCPEISQKDIEMLLAEIDSLPNDLRLDAKSIVNVYNADLNNVELTTTTSNAKAGVVINEIKISPDTNSLISDKEFREINKFVLEWKQNWMDNNGDTIKSDSQDMSKRLYSCLGIGLDVKDSVTNSYDLRNALQELSDKSGKYSDNKELIDKIYSSSLLTSEEYQDINGDGLFNTEEDMFFVSTLLIKKMVTEDSAAFKETKISLVSSSNAPSALVSQYSGGRIQQITLNDVKVPIFAAGYGDLVSGNSGVYVYPYGSSNKIGEISQGLLYVDNKNVYPAVNDLDKKKMSFN
ncbi:MAG TPA: hypothetical protein VHA12_02540 [Candidatus Nanoarchaeia archaeon]|nr:hypothetical protein [Candidatus Nanoarchaeia archaeon]